MQIKFKKLHPRAKLPRRGSRGAAGYDIHVCTLDVVGDLFMYGTGIAVEIPEGFCGMICPRFCGVFRRSHLYGPAIAERGETFLWLEKNGKDPEMAGYFFSTGERIAQLVVLPFTAIEPVWAEELSETSRGSGGYGSTGA